MKKWLLVLLGCLFFLGCGNTPRIENKCNIGKFIKDKGNFFIVANDKYDLYPRNVEKSGLKIVNKFKRPVLNRTERDRQPYAEIIFHMRKDK